MTHVDPLIEDERHLQASDATVEAARALRREVPRGTFAGWTPAPQRPDPVETLLEQDRARSTDLVPIRHGRMGASAFAFYRGGAAIMAADLAVMPVTGLTTQLCGDAHLSNLGVFASPERRLLFDLNDFDETLPGPWEWDVARLVASFAIAADAIGARTSSDRTSAARECARSYRDAMAGFARTNALDTWYARLDLDEFLVALEATAPKQVARRAREQTAKTRTRTSLQAARKLTRLVDGKLRIVHDPPLLVPLSSMVAPADTADVVDRIRETYRQYRNSLPSGPRRLLADYEFVDIGHKVVGVGSVGLRAFIVVLQCRRTAEPLILQVKEATTSVLEPFLGPSGFEQPGQRVVEGQRMMQAASDLFLGWSSSPNDDRYFYWRQLRDMKGSVEVERMVPKGLSIYARMCGWSLARAHARSGPASAIAGYLGSSDRFERAMAEFASRYARQNRVDFEAHRAAVADGRIPALVDV
ncbi:MAG TPA: DUF2252 domain-containing protein [Ilumatobacter sp.]|nr:DUF2252 domain-containing protein [Ilumatobacter sp.]